MAKCSEKKSARRARGIIVALVAMAPAVLAGQPYGEEAEAPLEVFLLPRAEENLSVGNVGAAVDLYRGAFAAAATFEERLALIGPLARALLVNQDLDALLEAPTLAEGGGFVEDWEQGIFQAAAFQFLQDLTEAGREVLASGRARMPADYRNLLRRQAAAWAEEAGDFEAALVIAREAFRDEATLENHAGYLRALLAAGSEEELISHARGERADLVASAGLWRSLLPDILGAGMLETLAPRLEETWDEAAADPAAAFALAELRVFQGRMDEATELFWNLFAREEPAMSGEGLLYFRRLNQFFHNRFAVKNRLGQATGRYGTDGCRRFLFLGLREDLRLDQISEVRDAALLYARVLTTGEQESADFLRRVREELDRVPARPPAERILAFAGIGAPGWMLDEIGAFLEGEHHDNAAAEFALLAINRYVLSTEKFPGLRERMGMLARMTAGKLEEGAPPALERRRQEMEKQILWRLGLADPEQSSRPEEPGSLGDYHARIVAAAQEGDPEEAERLYRELLLQGGESGPGPENALLFLARVWQDQSVGRAARLVAEYLAPVYRRNGGSGQDGPLRWRGTEPFPPPNPFLSQADLEVMAEAFESVAGTAVWEALKEAMAEQSHSLPRELQPGACAAAGVFFWWAGEPNNAIARLQSCADRLEDPDLRLLLAHLLGLEGRYQEASAVLRAIPLEAPGAGRQVPRLLFAFAVAAGEKELAAAQARDLAGLPLSGPDRLHLASGLIESGLVEEGAEWVEDLALHEIDPREEELYHRVWLQVRLARGEHDRAEGLARFVLMGEMPEWFATGADPAREEALEALAAIGRLDSYQEQLRQLLEVAPQSLSVRLLLGESADFRWRNSAETLPEQRQAAADEAIDSYRKAVELRPLDGEMRLGYCDWLAARGWWEEAVSQYQQLLQTDPQSALLDSTSLFRAYRQAGRLPLLVDFLEQWEVPEAGSMDEFYGLQPTEHLFRPLGEALVEEGEIAAAVRAWEKGLRINPVAFTEQIRLALAEFYAEAGRTAELLEVLKGYVMQENPDPHLYAVQPFATVVPRWIGSMNAAAEPASAPLERLLSLAAGEAPTEELRVAAEGWRAEMPGGLSPAVFDVYLSARSDAPGWRSEFIELREEFGLSRGPFDPAWEAVEELLGPYLRAGSRP